MAMYGRPDERHGFDPLSKVPRVTLIFWVIKIFATTLGETGGDAVTMTWKLGYAVGSLIFLAFFAASVAGRAAVGCVAVVSPDFVWSGAVVVACACGGVGVIVAAPSAGCDGLAQLAKSVSPTIRRAQDSLVNDFQP
jgi:hypothetical protein